jgi:hypothetical protein
MYAQSNVSTVRPTSAASNLVAQILCMVALVLVLASAYPGTFSMHHVMSIVQSHSH